jgi:hypothetical protein
MSETGNSPYRIPAEESVESPVVPEKMTVREGAENLYDNVMDCVDTVRERMFELTGIPAAARLIFGQGSYRYAQRVTRGERRELQRERLNQSKNNPESK